MLLPIACLALAHSGFPAQPIASDFAFGVKLARRERSLQLSDLFATSDPKPPVTSVLKRHKKAIGWWSNGYEQKSVEHAIWISPSLVSKWLGFLSAREYWTDEEVRERWGRAAECLGDRRLFVIQLSAFPKMSTYGVGETAPVSLDDFDDVRFVYTSEAGATPMHAVLLEHRQSRNRFELDDFDWWTRLPLAGALDSEFRSDKDDWSLPVGEYHRSWYVAWVQGADDPKFEVRVLSKRKERVARFP